MLYPQINKSRMVLDLSGIWKFKLDDGHGFEERWMDEELTEAENIAVPASYNDQLEGSRYRDHYGWAFYQKKVTVPAVMLGQRLVLRFGSVTHASKVYLLSLIHI